MLCIRMLERGFWKDLGGLISEGTVFSRIIKSSEHPLRVAWLAGGGAAPMCIGGCSGGQGQELPENGGMSRMGCASQEWRQDLGPGLERHCSVQQGPLLHRAV